jgi:hypothetical protein
MTRKNQERQLNPAERSVQRAEQAAARLEEHNRAQAILRLSKERGIQIERAELAFSALTRGGVIRRNTIGVVTRQGSDPEYLIQGIRMTANSDSGSVLTLQAETSEEDMEDVKERMAELQASGSRKSPKIVIVKDANFSDPEMGASPPMLEIMSGLAVASALVSAQYPDLSLMVAGRGDLCNVPGSQQYDRSVEPPFAGQYLNIILELDAHNELSSAPGTGSPTRLSTLKPFKPSNARVANYPAVAPSSSIVSPQQAE